MNALKIEHLAVIFALIAAIIAAFNPPLSKIVVSEIQPVMSAAFLNLGSGIGFAIFSLFAIKTPIMDKKCRVRKSDMPWILGISACEMLGAICMMAGLMLTTAANASLLGNFETVAIAVFALILFKEVISKRLWIAIVLITIGSILLTIEDFSSFSFSIGSIFVLGACAFWGLEINLMKHISSRNPAEIVTLKGLIAGIGCLIFALIIGENLPSFSQILLVMLLGLFTYGAAIMFLIYSQRKIGATKSGVIYGTSPFIATIISCIIFHDVPGIPLIIAFILMLVGIYFATIIPRKRQIMRPKNSI